MRTKCDYNSLVVLDLIDDKEDKSVLNGIYTCFEKLVKSVTRLIAGIALSIPSPQLNSIKSLFQ